MDQLTSSLPAEAQRRALPVDIEHGGIRLAVPLLALGSFAALFVLLSALGSQLIPDFSGGCLVFIGSVVGALLLALAADNVLKRVWPSGRDIVVDADGLTLNDNRRKAAGTPPARIHWDQRVNILAWRFTVKRGSARVAKNSIMLGLQVVQDETQIIAYTFAPNKEADETRYEDFEQLVLRDVLNKGQMSIRESNQQRRLLRAEDERWRDGAELRYEDFAFLVETIKTHIPNWRE